MHIKLLRPLLIGTKVHSEGQIVTVEDLHGRELVNKKLAEQSEKAAEAEPAEAHAADEASAPLTSGTIMKDGGKAHKPAKHAAKS